MLASLLRIILLTATLKILERGLDKGPIIEDRKRGQYYTYYTGNMWGDPSNYTASINTSRITLEKGADLIINYIETLQK